MPVTERHLETMRRTLDRARDLMDRGRHREAMEFIQTLYEAIDYWSFTRDPELLEILTEARRLAGEVRGRMGGPRMGARGRPKDYAKMAKRDAVERAELGIERIVADIIKKGQTSGDPQDYKEFEPRGIFYSSREAVEVLEQLSEHQETDSGLWEGMDPLEALPVIATYTYENAVYQEFTNLLEYIDVKVDEVREGLKLRTGPKEWRPGAKGPTKEAVEKIVKGVLREEAR